MPTSSYQVEWLINQRRRWRGLVRMVERGLRSLGDRVEVSGEGGRQARELGTPPPRVTKVSPYREGGIWPADLADTRSRGAAVDYELERRAGSFMEPKYPPYPSPTTFRKVKPPATVKPVITVKPAITVKPPAKAR